MIVYKCWYAYRRSKNLRILTDKWLREGWFLFGCIPLYVRDRENRNKY